MLFAAVLCFALLSCVVCVLFSFTQLTLIWSALFDCFCVGCCVVLVWTALIDFYSWLLLFDVSASFASHCLAFEFCAVVVFMRAYLFNLRNLLLISPFLLFPSILKFSSYSFISSRVLQINSCWIVCVLPFGFLLFVCLFLFYFCTIKWNLCEDRKIFIGILLNVLVVFTYYMK